MSQTLIDVESAWKNLKSQEQNLEAEIEQPLPKYGWLSVFCSLWHPSPSPKLSKDLLRDKEVLIALSKRPFSHDDSTHVQMLLTLFNSLTGLHCPSVIGTHWDIVGFQGTDPSTDFRGVGILGLLQPLALSLSCSSFMLEVISLSHSPSQGFPFMVLSLNVTHIVLVSLRDDGNLDRLINEKGAALDAVNLCYGAALFHIYDHWKKENLTLVDSGLLLKKAETAIRKNLQQCIKEFESYIESQSATRNATLSAAVRLEEVHFHIDGEPTGPIPIIKHTVLN